MNRRTRSGQHIIELAAGLIFFVPLILYGIDYAVILYAGQVNSSVCTAACRAAAQGPPSGCSEDPDNTPANRASAVIKTLSQKGSAIKMKKTVRVKEVVHDPIPTTQFGGPFVGTVSIKTRCTVYPPITLPLVPEYIALYAKQSFPWTYVVPAKMGSSFPILPSRADNLGLDIPNELE